MNVRKKREKHFHKSVTLIERHESVGGEEKNNKPEGGIKKITCCSLLTRKRREAN